MNIIDELKSKAKLSENDEMIVKYIIDYIEEIPYISSRELAKRTYTTATSISRLVKKLGYENYSDFKYHIVSSLKNINIQDLSIVSQEDVLSLINKVSQLEIETIQTTKEMLRVDKFENIMNELVDKKYIDIIAIDTNAQIAQYAAHVLSYTGKIVQVYYEVDRQVQYCLNTNEDHVVVFISKYANHKHMLDCASLLNKKHITTIAMTNSEKNALAIRCQYVLLIPFRSDSRMHEIDFYIGIKYLFDLCFFIFE